MNLSTDSETIEATAAQWFAKRNSAHWSEADQAQLDRWLQTATAHRVAFIRLDAAWQLSARLKALGAGVPAGVIPTRHSWGFSPLFDQGTTTQAIPAILPNPRSGIIESNKSKKRWAFAASILLAAAGGLGWYFSADKPDSYRTQVGKTATIALPDGSQVTLNTDSRIRVALNRTERRIELDQGEAFFVVAKDSNRPFTVTAGDKRVVAVGTEFSIRREADEVRVVVADGRVRLERGADSDDPPTQLDAGAVAQTTQTGVRVQQRSMLEVEQILSWRTGYVRFRDTELAEAVAEFNRYSTRKITIEDAEIADIRIGGNFRTDNVEAFLWLLQNGFPVDVERRDDRIILTAR